MILLVNIALIVFSQLSDNAFSDLNHKCLNADYSNIELIFNVPEETNQENYFSSLHFEHQKEINHFSNSVGNDLNNEIQNKSTSFLNRLLPSLIDVPPPPIEFYIP